MGGGMMGGFGGRGWSGNGGVAGNGTGTAGTIGSPWTGYSAQCLGPGSGMAGAGGLKSGIFNQTMKRGYLDLLAPIATADEAVAAVEAFIAAANSTLQVSEVWEYQTVYKIELADAAGVKAFDVVADKLTGSVLPEMGFSMMMNASWGRQLQATPRFAKRTVVTPEAATAAVEAFLAKNVGIIDYTIAAQENYPGFYKFHTTDAAGNPGMDIMVNGYSGAIWMNTQLGAPVPQIQ